MTPAIFPEANQNFKAPEDLDESQVFTIPAYSGNIQGGNLDGAPVVVTAWLPSPEDLERLNAGGAVYLAVIGGLPPHLMATTFKDAVIQE
jgi:hypothetical protein